MNGFPGPAPAPAEDRTPPAPPAPRLALFRIGGRLCGVPAAFCKQFVHLDAVTPVPLGPAHLLGVTQLRGRILPVLDPSLLPGMSESRPADAPGAPPGIMQVLVVTATGVDSALAALKVTEIVGFERPSGGTGARPLWRGEAVAVLDVADVLAHLRPGPRDLRPR